MCDHLPAAVHCERNAQNLTARELIVFQKKSLKSNVYIICKNSRHFIQNSPLLLFFCIKCGLIKYCIAIKFIF